MHDADPTPAPIGSRWRDYAACLDEDPELFFPVGAIGLTYDAQVRDAKRVCLRCDVLAECRAWALAVMPSDGVAGGLDPKERKAAKRAAARKARPTKTTAATPAAGTEEA